MHKMAAENLQKKREGKEALDEKMDEDDKKSEDSEKIDDFEEVYKEKEKNGWH